MIGDCCVVIDVVFYSTKFKIQDTRWIFHKMHLPVISNPTCDTCVGRTGMVRLMAG